MPCPACQSERFYVKDDDDPYETTEFAIHGGVPVFEEVQDDAPALTGDSQIYCNHCSWRGRLDQLN
ncbi:MAG: hypothetical protein K9K66_11125 [Desulfarculaceae bacterium]|nr:hypothetical protein [Desulfarculaceae bacterium]MCF8070762.1 hypothetical protein [Desulfarculaceae bacterium]MCF8102199.1 hypothetical protein [Desulfarculaceae bacterium]MCF8117002.1 hypothetical protein [Desulfarculaceae bacterium]